jgi:hypothetical protein
MRVIICILFSIVSLGGIAQIDTITWQQLSSLPDGLQRTGPGCFLIDSDFYVAGGQEGGSGTINTVWKYHIPNDSWTQMGNLPFGASASCSFLCTKWQRIFFDSAGFG